jgi:hypothetical protein
MLGSPELIKSVSGDIYWVAQKAYIPGCKHPATNYISFTSKELIEKYVFDWETTQLKLLGWYDLLQYPNDILP